MNKPTVEANGRGYVGQPFVVEFAKHGRTIDFDIHEDMVATCRAGKDPSHELTDAQMAAATHTDPTADGQILAEAEIIIVAVPTSVDEANIPDFMPLIRASTYAGRQLKQGAIVVYESTDFLGGTEEWCAPLQEKESGLKWKQDFLVGYSAERTNPGEKENTFTKILKIISGNTPETVGEVAKLCEMIVGPGVHRSNSIKAAEAAKVLENPQRDLKITLIYELTIICDKLGTATSEALEAAGTKRNFLKFEPGLVGGHCIGMDPQYLTHEAKMVVYPVRAAARSLSENRNPTVWRSALPIHLPRERKPSTSAV